MSAQGINVSVPDRERGGQRTKPVRVIDWGVIKNVVDTGLPRADPPGYATKGARRSLSTLARGRSATRECMPRLDEVGLWRAGWSAVDISARAAYGSTGGGGMGACPFVTGLVGSDAVSFTLSPRASSSVHANRHDRGLSGRWGLMDARYPARWAGLRNCAPSALGFGGRIPAYAVALTRPLSFSASFRVVCGQLPAVLCGLRAFAVNWAPLCPVFWPRPPACAPSSWSGAMPRGSGGQRRRLCSPCRRPRPVWFFTFS